jgi:hypothetical protein
MKTFTSLRGLAASYCNVTVQDTNAMTVIDTNINDSIRTICNLQGGKLRFLEATKDMYTVADQETYQIPNGFRKLIDMYIYSDDGSTPSSRSTIYSPEMVYDPTKWKRILQYRLGTQDVPYFTYVENTTYKIQPVPSTTGNLIKLRGRLQTRNLTIPDYTTGTIVSVANDGVTVVGNGTTWTQDMVGRYINIPNTTAANGGDGFWYEIGGFTNATTITLVKPYEGTSIVAGSASYVIGECSVIPEAYDIAIVYRATALYWQNQNDLNRAKTYWTLYDGGNEAGYSKEYGGLISQMLANEGETQEGSYVPPAGSTLNLPQAPYYQSFQDATGFN